MRGIYSIKKGLWRVLRYVIRLRDVVETLFPKLCKILKVDSFLLQYINKSEYNYERPQQFSVPISFPKFSEQIFFQTFIRGTCIVAVHQTSV